MAKCMCCNKTVSSGFVVCASCAKNVGDGKVPLDTMRFIGKLAEEIIDSNVACPCSMCSFECRGGEDTLKCPDGIRAWLTDKATAFFGESEERRAAK